MNKDEIIRMAQEAGFLQHLGLIAIPNILEQFAALVAAAERERAEKAEAELAALRERLASWDALERMADNARELGLDYDEPVKEKNCG